MKVKLDNIIVTQVTYKAMLDNTYPMKNGNIFWIKLDSAEKSYIVCNMYYENFSYLKNNNIFPSEVEIEKINNGIYFKDEIVKKYCHSE